MGIDRSQHGDDPLFREMVDAAAQSLIRLAQAHDDIGKDMIPAEYLHRLHQGIHYLLVGHAGADALKKLPIGALQVVLDLRRPRLTQQAIHPGIGADGDADGNAEAA